MSSRGKWEDMVKSVLDVVAPVKRAAPKPKEESKKMTVEDVPGDPGSTVGQIRDYKKRQESALSEL